MLIRASILALVATSEAACVGISYSGAHVGRVLESPVACSPGEVGKGDLQYVATPGSLRESWGRPDRIEHKSDGTERWTYYGALRWSGVLVFAVVLPIPLFLPVGRERVSIDFRNGTAVAADAIASEELWSAFLGLHLHDGWIAEAKCSYLTEMPEIELKGHSRK